jgi:hypothetical protein
MKNIGSIDATVNIDIMDPDFVLRVTYQIIENVTKEEPISVTPCAARNSARVFFHAPSG